MPQWLRQISTFIWGEPIKERGDTDLESVWEAAAAAEAIIRQREQYLREGGVKKNATADVLKGIQLNVADLRNGAIDDAIHSMALAYTQLEPLLDADDKNDPLREACRLLDQAVGELF
ncbi:hypothetical protein QA648_27475 (plasmid) [Rhizobium sp. CB3171]|uniref:hypothetical protein n=1 Tax=Rhizobium sp. CB3171 TaxID=3039157 RepID=UPI0024B251E4|nr:hypothetical protein [Rhizobium sp. CB3171]WFU04524.1 hypothetical protein QA648_27475 [Rhizobium sp. CB3171]